jgi:hypothetical protein
VASRGRYNVLNKSTRDNTNQLNFREGDCLQATTSESVPRLFLGKFPKPVVKRLTPADYSQAGILKSYDWSVSGREAHDVDMEKYRVYLMKLCCLSHELEAAKQERSR